MGILDKLNERFNTYKEMGIDFGPVSGNIVVKANEVTTFPSIYEGENITGAIRTGDIVLVESTLGRQERGQQGAKTGEWQLVLETTFALPEARLGAWEDDEFVELPLYNDEHFQRLLNQTPLVFGQLLKANFEVNENAPTAEEKIQPGNELVQFKQALDDAGYIPRKRNEDSQFVSQRTRLWSVEAPNRQSGNYGNDLSERVSNGLPVDDFTIVPPTNLDRTALSEQDKVALLERGRFVDLFSSWLANLERVAMGLDPENDAETKRTARKLASSLTGASNDGGPLYASRASIPQFSIASGHYEQQGRNRIWVADPAASYSFWSPRATADAPANA
jgi:hypothetical protein